MKVFNHFLGLFFMTILIGITSCAKQDLQVNENLVPTTKAASAAFKAIPIIVNNNAYNATSDLFTAVDFTIEDEIIMLTTSYTGGCGVAEFRLVADSQMQGGSGNIPVFNSKLILENNDKCNYLIKKTSSFDLTPLQQNGYSQVMLKIAGFGEILYSY